MNVVYVVRRFPKTSETFVSNEVREVMRQGDRVSLFSLKQPHRDEPVHPQARALSEITRYVPDDRTRGWRLAAAGLGALARRPLRAGPALGWVLVAALRQHRLRDLKQFGEAAWIANRLPAGTEHLHAHFAHAPATVVLLLSRMTGLPYSFTGHANDIFRLVPHDLLAAKIAEASFVAAVSEHTRDHLVRIAEPADRDKIVVVRNGVDRARFSLSDREPGGPPLLLCVSRLVEKKGVDTLIDTCALLADRRVEFRCEVYGDGPLRADLQDRIDELGLGSRVSLLGYGDQRQVLAAYRRAAMLVAPCRKARNGDADGLPVAIVEAMAAGVPVVSTPTSGIPEVVRDGESGMLVPPADAGALAWAIQRVLGDEELRHRLVMGGRAASAAFDEAATVAGLRALFQRGPETAEPSHRHLPSRRRWRHALDRAAPPALPGDPELPALAAIAEHGVDKVLERLGVRVDTAGIRLLTHHPGSRCTFSSGAPGERVFFKAFAEPTAPRVELLDALEAQGLTCAGGLMTPPLVAHDPVLQLIAMGPLEGATGWRLIERGQGERAGALAAECLQTLARAPIAVGQSYDTAALIEQGEHWVRSLRRNDARLGALAQARLAALARALPGPAPVGLVHGSFVPNHVLDLGEGPGLIDWDNVGQGSMEYDVGLYLAALRRTGSDGDGLLTSEVAHAAHALLSGVDGLADEKRIAWFESACLIKLAKYLGNRRPPGWRERAELLLAYAEASLTEERVPGHPGGRPLSVVPH